MNLPNQITLARLALTGLFVGALTWDGAWSWSGGCVLFIIASITDYFDGYLARKKGLVTAFGALMDPLVDKILICSAFVMLACQSDIPPWIVTLVLAREFLITGLRLVAAGSGAILSADDWGKWKTVSQIATAIYFLLHHAVVEPPLAWFGPFFDVRLLAPDALGRLFLGLTVFTTVWSGMRYLLHNRHVIKDA